MHPQTQQRIDQLMMPLHGRTAHVIGVSGIEGYTMAHFLVSQGHKNIVVHDYLEGDALQTAFVSNQGYLDAETAIGAWEVAKQWPVDWRTGPNYLGGIGSDDQIFLSQNWFAYAQNQPLASFVEENPEQISSLLGLTLACFPGKTIGVTGSNGKSTTVALIGSVLEAAGELVRYAGNERSRPQVLQELDAVTPQDTLVLEISNRQLKLPLTISPHIAVVTNVLPNHIVDHGSFEAYQQAKANIFANQVAGDVLVLSGDNPVTVNWQGSSGVQTQFFSTERELDAFVRNGVITLEKVDQAQPVMSLEDLPIAGKHFQQNVMAALLATSALGVNTKSCIEGIRNFKSLSGRLDLVLEHNDIAYYNDIKSTVPQATIAALESLATSSPQRNIVLICGGEHKQVSYSELAKIIVKTVRELILLPGTAAEEIKAVVDRITSKNPGQQAPKVHQVTDFASACEIVRQQQRPGDSVLLSPAGAFFTSTHFQAGESIEGRIIREFSNS